MGSLAALSRPSEPTGRVRMDVVVVDDDVHCARLLHAALLPLGIGVRAFERAEDGLEDCRRSPPDLAIFDLDLPGLSGFDATRRLREHKHTARVPILILSGHGDPQSRIAAYASGADCFLVKPFEVDELRAVVESLGARGRELRDVEEGWSVLRALAEIVDLRCLDARGHMERCARLGAAFGTLLGLPIGDQLALERAGYLHDIGKVGVPFEVLNKTGPLTAEERLEMQKHPEIGARICEHLATLRNVVPIVHRHHERWDGSGYPDGLAGEAIPLLARVFQVVDVFEALVSERCYKPAMKPLEALDVLVTETRRGYWDPDLVGAFESAVRDGWLQHAAAPQG